MTNTQTKTNIETKEETLAIFENEGNIFSGITPKDIESNLFKFKSKLGKLGIKKIKNRADLNQELIEKELTLYIRPYYNDFDSTSRRTSRDSFKDFYNHLMSLGGSEGYSEYTQLKQGVIETQEILKVKFKGKKFSIGDYIRERNIVIICVPLALNNFKLGDKYEYLDFYIKCVEEVFKTYKIKEENTEGIAKRQLLKRYLEFGQRNLKEKKNALISAKDSLESCTKEVIQFTARIRYLNLDIESIKSILGNLEDSIIEQLEELKNLKFLKEAILTENGIKLSFEKIFIKVKGKDIEMGEYEILLKPKEFEIINKQPVEYEGDTFHSCHVQDKAICFGDGNTLAYELLGKMELKKLAHFLHIFLKTYNPEDNFLSMNYWIKGKENGGIVPEDYNNDEEDEGDYE